jgi:branched-chain amino acid transport system ATP-binding protein/urea transport system ATP-binding protein
MSILTCDNLVMRFGGVAAIDGVDFAMDEGMLHCLIGPNGAGKSTFFKMITGQLTPSAGKVRLRDDTITGLRSSDIVRRGIGIKMQTPQLFDELSVRENIWLGLRRRLGRVQAAERVSDLIAEFRLGEFAQSIVGSLAHGIRQRVDIASVLAGEPDLILLDEPAAGMSDKEVESIADIILGLKKRHSFLVVEHDMTFIRRIADRVTVLHQGKVFAEGMCNEVLADQGVRDIYLGRGVVNNA